MSDQKQRLSRKSILGYGVASMADAASYNFIFMYFLFFLTDVAGINAALAGTLYSIAIIYDALTNPVIGQLSDNTRSKFGRRRPYLLASAVPIALAVWLMFTAIAAGDTGKFIYYLIFMMIFWTAYNLFYIPYTALGAEMTDDYDERTKLRAPATIFNLAGNIVGMSLPLLIISKMVNSGSSPGGAWSKFAAIVGIVSMVSIFITWKLTKGKEINTAGMEEHCKENPFKTYWKILKLKPYKFQIGIVLCFILAYSMFNSTMTYYIHYVAGLTEAQQSYALFIYILIGVVLVPVITFVSNRLGKKNTMALFFIISAACLLILRFVGIHSFGMLVLCLGLFGIGNGAYWLLMPAMGYDITEVYEFEYGERREGGVMALIVFIVKIASALGVQAVAITLSTFGYDAMAEVQSAAAISGIENAFLVIPAIAFAVGAIFAFGFPLTKEKFDKLITALEAKREGKDYYTDGLERIIRK